MKKVQNLEFPDKRGLFKKINDKLNHDKPAPEIEKRIPAGYKLVKEEPSGSWWGVDIRGDRFSCGPVYTPVIWSRRTAAEKTVKALEQRGIIEKLPR